MEREDLLEQPTRAIIDLWLGILADPKRNAEPSFTGDEAAKAAKAQGYKTGRKRDATGKSVHTALQKLVAAGIVERPLNARTGKPIRGRYKITGTGYLRGLVWLSALRFMNSAKGKDVVTMRSADRPDFLSRLASQQGTHVWATRHLVTDPDAPEAARKALQSDAALGRAVEKAWEDLEKAVKDYAKRDKAFPPFAVVLQFNRGVRPGRRQGTAPPPPPRAT